MLFKKANVCKRFTILSVALRLFNLKARSGHIDKSFTELLELLKEMLLEGNTLSKRIYEAKKILCQMSLDYNKIHVIMIASYIGKSLKNLKECPRYG